MIERFEREVPGDAMDVVHTGLMEAGEEILCKRDLGTHHRRNY